MNDQDMLTIKGRLLEYGKVVLSNVNPPASIFYYYKDVDTLLKEVERLRWRLNHQTEDDAEACRQGKHEDCGK